MDSRSNLTNQSPEWMAASLHGTLSHTTEPTSSTTGNPIHNSNPRPTAPINPTPTSPNRSASTYVTTELRRSSTIIIQAGGRSDAPPCVPNCLSRPAPNTMYHTPY